MRKDTRLFDESCDESCVEFDEGPLDHDPDGSYCGSCDDEF